MSTKNTTQPAPADKPVSIAEYERTAFLARQQQRHAFVVIYPRVKLALERIEAGQIGTKEAALIKLFED